MPVSYALVMQLLLSGDLLVPSLGARLDLRRSNFVQLCLGRTLIQGASRPRCCVVRANRKRSSSSGYNLHAGRNWPAGSTVECWCGAHTFCS